MKNRLAFLVILFTLCSSAWSQDLTAMYNQHVNQTNAYFQARTHNLVQNNMQDPRIQYAYQCYRSQGGAASFPQFAYMYAATGGFTQQGMNYYNQVNQGIANQQQQAWSAYQQAQGQRQQAMNQWQNGYYQNQNEAGYNLQGNATYSTPEGNVVLPYTQGQQYYYQYPNGSYAPIYKGR